MNLAFQVTDFAFQGLGQNAFQGTSHPTGGGALWAKGRGKLNLRRRPLTYSETEELAIRMQAIAAEKAAAAISMDRISDVDGHVIGEDSDDDDILIQAAWRLLH